MRTLRTPRLALRPADESAMPPPLDSRPAWTNYTVHVDAGPDGPGVGLCGLLFRDDGGVEIGYRIEPGHRRQGYAREALTRLIRHAFEDFALPALEAEVAEDNVPSLALLAQLGFIDAMTRREQWSGRRNAYINYQRHRLDRSDWNP